MAAGAGRATLNVARSKLVKEVCVMTHSGPRPLNGAWEDGLPLGARGAEGEVKKLGTS